MADDVLRQGIQGISELITIPGLINLDFADVKAIMSQGGAALMAVGVGKGEERARMAAQNAVSSALLDVTIDGAQGVLFNITGGNTLSLFEVNQAAAIIRETAHPDANVIFGAVIDPALEEDIRITVIATGFQRATSRRQILPRMETTPLFEERQERAAQEPLKVTVEPEKERQPAEVDAEGEPAQSPRFSPNNLDIPAFLRRG